MHRQFLNLLQENESELVCYWSLTTGTSWEKGQHRLGKSEWTDCFICSFLECKYIQIQAVWNRLFQRDCVILVGFCSTPKTLTDPLAFAESALGVVKVKEEVYKYLQCDAGGSRDGTGVDGVREGSQDRNKRWLTLSTSQQKVEVLLNVLLLDISFSSYSSVLMS